MRSKALRAAAGGVVEAGAQGDVVVVQAIGVELYFGARRPVPRRKLTVAAFADHIDRPLPRERSGDGLDGDIDAATLRGVGRGRRPRDRCRGLSWMTSEAPKRRADTTCSFALDDGK